MFYRIEKTNGSTLMRWHSLLLIGTANDPKEMQDIIAASQPQDTVHWSNILFSKSHKVRGRKFFFSASFLQRRM